MSAKKVNIGKKPVSPETPTSVDEWVSNRDLDVDVTPAEDKEPVKLKRLTLDISSELHFRIKRQALESGVTMADLLRELLLQHFGSGS